MERPSSATELKIKTFVDRDLRPNPLSMHAKIASAFLLGGFLSLSICAQFGLGLTPWSFAIQEYLMHFGAVGCIAACGVLFALFPLILLRLIHRPMQFRLLTRQYSTPLIAWLIATEFSLLVASGFNISRLEPLIWLASAAATIWLGTHAIDRFSAAQATPIRATY